MRDEIKTLDPHELTDTVSEDAARKIYEGLVDFDERLRPVPRLAERWTVSPDGLTWTFTLKAGVQFHSGTPFDAQAVKASFDRLLSGKCARSSFFRFVKSVRAVDPGTVAFELKQPFAPFLSRLAASPGLIIDPALIRKKGASLRKTASGTGPFAFFRWKGKEFVSLTANKAYWGGAPKLAALVYRFGMTEKVRVRDMERGAYHVLCAPDFADYRRLSRLSGLAGGAADGAGAFALVVNTARGPFADARVRRALSMAINRVTIAKVVYDGFAAPLHANAAPTVFCAGSAGANVPYDAAQAKRLLDEAGWSRTGADGVRVNSAGVRLSAELTTTRDPKSNLVTLLQGFGRTVGIELKPRRVNEKSLREALAQNAAPMAWSGFWPSSGEAGEVYQTLFAASDRPPEGGSGMCYGNADVDAALSAALREPDAARRTQLYDAVERQLALDVPRIPIAAPKHLFVTRRSVRGLRFSPLGWLIVDQNTSIGGSGGGSSSAAAESGC